jgi:hypothetical protein
MTPYSPSSLHAVAGTTVCESSRSAEAIFDYASRCALGFYLGLFPLRSFASLRRRAVSTRPLRQGFYLIG